MPTRPHAKPLQTSTLPATEPDELGEAFAKACRRLQDAREELALAQNEVRAVILAVQLDA